VTRAVPAPYRYTGDCCPRCRRLALPARLIERTSTGVVLGYDCPDCRSWFTSYDSAFARTHADHTHADLIAYGLAAMRRLTEAPVLAKPAATYTEAVQ